MYEPRVRKIHRKLAKIMADDGDHCTICRMEFLGGEIIYGGVTDSGAVEWVSDCCVHELKEIYSGGVVVW